jgi:hypothetical protein
MAHSRHLEKSNRSITSTTLGISPNRAQMAIALLRKRWRQGKGIDPVVEIRLRQ